MEDRSGMAQARRNVAADLCMIGLAVLLYLAALALFGAIGFGTTLRVQPMAEMLGWVDMLRGAPGAQAARRLWEIDSRNPLSPWWYIAVRRLIVHSDYGLTIVRYGVGFALAACAYGTVLAIAGRAARGLALAIGIAVAAWAANRYLDFVFWNFQGALAFSLLSVLLFVRSERHGPFARLAYASSVLCYFVAVTTYTIQCGAVVAIFWLGLRRQLAGGQRLPGAVLRAVAGAAPHAAVLGLYLLIWQTTMLPRYESVFGLAPDLKRLGGSILQGVASVDLGMFWIWFVVSPHRIAYAVVALALAALFTLAVARTERPMIDSRRLGGWVLLDVAIVVLALALPTIAVETSSAMWPAGTRWPMIYQLTWPVFVLVALLALARLAAPGAGRRLWLAGVFCLVAAGFAASFGYARVQGDISGDLSFVRQSLRETVAAERAAGHAGPIRFLLLVEPSLQWPILPAQSPAVSRVWFGRDDVSFRVAPGEPSPSGFERWWSPRLSEAGVANWNINGAAASWDSVRVMRLGKGAAERIGNVTDQTFAGRFMVIERALPFALPYRSPAP